MNHIELKTARQLLCLSVQDAAEHIGGVKQRSWEYWEQGKKPVPDDVAERINHLLNRRHDILATVQQKMLRDDADLKGVAVVYYTTPEDCESVLDWRFSQSLAQTLAHDYGAKLVLFDSKKYIAWLLENGMQDTSEKRSEWAAWSASNDK
ncbi:YdiL family protein [Wielerella bovis]|uniref:Aca2/YdiL-like domain-containing protein n=1 Tax=Wielerella bovis TaxID=2917790 RepID=UPI002018D2BD|nr:DUF1870 family protein [Wielerella bovis]ULJ64612.1 YdiL family protein [Wielerella bovis]